MTQRAAPKPKKGHWPRGKPRHPETATRRARRQLDALGQFFHRHRSPAVSASPVSIKAAAIAIGVSPRSVARWLHGTQHPHPTRLAALLKWRQTRPED